MVSERVFSSCGLVQTAKRSRLIGRSVRNQVIIHKNLSALNMSIEEILLNGNIYIYMIKSLGYLECLNLSLLK